MRSIRKKLNISAAICTAYHVKYKMCVWGCQGFSRYSLNLNALEGSSGSSTETGFGKGSCVQGSEMEPPRAFGMDESVKTPRRFHCSSSGGWGCCLNLHQNMEGWNKYACLERSTIHNQIACLARIINIYSFTPSNTTHNQSNCSRGLVNIDSSKPSNTAQNQCLFPILHEYLQPCRWFI